ncbi:MAG: outer membrane protein assembly factor BamE, partial [Lonepinella koalarum]|nr:outer membrane protein assembly factor BamE [Lonepinella koalarum]
MKKQFIQSITVATILLGLTACGNLSEVNTNGTSDKPVFPTPDKATFSHNNAQPGAWANWEAIRAVKPGLSKAQVQNLIGHPHFGEGFFAVREWDYLFNYNENGQTKQCHLKMLFDSNKIAQTLLWHPNHCQPGQKTLEIAKQSITLSGDSLFDFNKSTLTTEGNISVEQAAKQVLQTKPVAIEVAGYTDPIGSNAYNLRLSQQRAEAVKQRLISLGVTTPITAKGYGKAKQVKACPGLRGSALHDCLKPNR